MIRVLHLITTMPVGGAENLILTTMRLLDPSRFSSILCCIQDKGPLGLEAERAGFKVIALNRMQRKGHDSQVVSDLVALLRDEHIDIVHCHLYHAALYGRLAARRAGVHSIVTIHNVYAKPKWHRRLINRWLNGHTEKLICVSQPVADDAMRYDQA